MNIELKKIQISNFKGIKDLEIEFGKTTNISGDNAKGKTTIFDAFCWVLFNKDSFNSAKFDIRPIDKDGNNIDYIDISVVVTLLVDGSEVVLQKIQKQKWVKKRGSETKTFEGNVNEYEVNGFPKAEKDFNKYISDFITDNVFMIVTNPAYFPNMKWKEQREALMELVSGITDDNVIAAHETENAEYDHVDKFDVLEDMLKENTADAWKEKYAKALREYNKQIDAIPSRIDEASRNIKEVDYSVEEEKLKELQVEYQKFEDQLQDASKAYEELNNTNEEIYKLKAKMIELESKSKTEHNKKLNELEQIKDKLTFEFSDSLSLSSDLTKKIETAKKQIEGNNKELEKSRADFKDIDAEHLSENALVCPTCSQYFPADKAEQIKDDFQDGKSKRLIEVRDKGHALNESNEELEEYIKGLETEVQAEIEKRSETSSEKNSILKEIEEYPELNMNSIVEYVELKAEIKKLQEKLADMGSGIDVRKSIKSKQLELMDQIDQVKKTLNGKEVIQDAKDRVKELQQEQKDLAQKVANTEKMIFLFEEFIKAKMDMLSETINSKFSLVKWKLFDIQINGGMKETCELTLNGVPYSSLNSAAKVQAGLDIINTMSAIYGVTAPIFIDNRESVNDIPDVDAQVINLIVTKDQELKVEVI